VQKVATGAKNRFQIQEYAYVVHFLEGEPERVIPQQAIRRKIDLVVMGTVVRTGLAGFLVCNTSEKVLDKLDCSVLAEKPNGFITPVRLESS
jgi:nucleotide-binding universal stress UspA family protein